MSDARKNKGGARAGSGRKKRATPVELIDGRTVTGSQHAQQLIDQLNSIDPEIMAHRELKVSLEPWEVPKDATDERRKEIEKLEAQRKLALVAKNVADTKFQKLSYEVQGWAVLWFAVRTALDTRRYLYDKAKGKAVVTVNHVHDKPIEVNHTFSISERIKRARERVANSKA